MSREARDEVEAKDRAGRAKTYAEKFPQFSKASAPWCNVDWQRELLARYREKSAAPKV